MITFVAYKPSCSISICGGVDSFESGFVLETDLKREELIEHWSNVLVENKKLSYGEEEYLVWVFENGAQLSGIGLTPYFTEANNLATTKFQEELAEKARQEQANKLAQDQKQKEFRRQQFEKLRQEFQS